jgi:HSP20 family molecular chaperone IbpA
MPATAKSRPPLEPGERIVLNEQGGYKIRARSGWKTTEFYLTNQRFFLYLQVNGIILDVPLKQITGIRVEKMYYVMRTREAINLQYQSETDKCQSVWIIVNQWRDWKKFLTQLCFLKLDHEKLSQIAALVDDDCRVMLDYFWRHGHAHIHQIAEAIDAPNHMHVLMLIRDSINPAAEKVVGCPVLAFERSKKDPVSGEKVFFNWWLMGRDTPWQDTTDRLLDILDEGSRLQVILEVKGVGQQDLSIDVQAEQLTVQSHKNGEEWQECFNLPVAASGHSPYIRLKNNLLEIRLEKLDSG